MGKKGNAIARVASESYSAPDTQKALATLSADYTAYAYIEILVDEILASKTPQRERIVSLGRLLSTYGVGTIVQGRLN